MSIKADVMKFFLAPELGAKLKMYSRTGESESDPEKVKWMYVSPFDLLLRFGTGRRVILWRNRQLPEETFMKIREQLDQTVTLKGGSVITKDSAAEYGSKELEFQFQINESVGLGPKKSYWRLGESELVVHHTKRLNEELRGAKSRNIEKMFVRNNSGESVLVPGTSLHAGRALAAVVNRTGSVFSPISRAVFDLIKEQSELRDFLRSNKGCSCSSGELALSRLRDLVQLFKDILKVRSYDAVVSAVMKYERIGRDRIQSAIESMESCTCSETDHPGFTHVARHYIRTGKLGAKKFDLPEKLTLTSDLEPVPEGVNPLIWICTELGNSLTSAPVSVKLVQTARDIENGSVTPEQIEFVRTVLRNLKSDKISDTTIDDEIKQTIESL